MIAEQVEQEMCDARPVGTAEAEVKPQEDSTRKAIGSSEVKTCNICHENIAEKEKPMFGISPNCDHMFCWPCINTWRFPADMDYGNPAFSNRLQCPVCRKFVPFVFPSTTWIELPSAINKSTQFITNFNEWRTHNYGLPESQESTFLPPWRKLLQTWM